MNYQNFSIDTLIEKLYSVKNKTDKKNILTKEEINFICNESLKIFKKQPILLELVPPLTICGDVHGQFSDLIRIFELGGSPEYVNYLFLGDYVDRGPCSINTICLLMLYKMKYPNNFFLLRGNHECSNVNKDYGFLEECRTFYDTSIWQSFNAVFNYFPVAATIDSRVFCVHAGISPSLHSLSDIKEIQRPLDIPDSGLLCDLMWSDPDPNVEEWGKNGRGISVTYGLQSVKNFFKELKIDLIVRAHQVVETGYDLPFPQDRSVLTIFGVPNYMGDFGNKAALLHVSDKLICTFIIVEPLINKTQQQKIHFVRKNQLQKSF